MPGRSPPSAPALCAARALLAAALAAMPGTVASAQPAASLDAVIGRAQELKRARPALDEVITHAQELKRSAPPAAAPLGGIVADAQAMKRKAAAEAEARPRVPSVDPVLDRAQELKRKHARDPLPPLPPPSVGRIVEQVQGLKQRAAEAAQARDRETAALIKEVERPPSPEEMRERKERFIRDRLDPMLGERRTFLVNLDQHIRKHGILAFVAGLSDADKRISAELVRITEEQRAVMARHPDLFTEDDLHSSRVLTDLLKILAE